jgi:heat shock protein HtpX
MRAINNLKTTFLLGSLMALCMLIGHYFSGQYGMLMGFLFGGLGCFVSYFFSDKLAILAHGGREVQPEDLPWLHEMIEQLAGRAGLPKPRIYVCPQAAPNAFATGRNPRHAAVALTAGMLENFPRPEIEGVMAHELAHVKHRDVLISTIAAVMAGTISQLGYMMMWFGGSRDGDRGNPLGAVGMILMIVLAPLAAMLIQMAISRQREYAADSYGAELCGDPRMLAAALARLGRLNERIPTNTNPAFHSMYIAEPLSGGGVMGLFATHPPLEKRINLLLAMAR